MADADHQLPLYTELAPWFHLLTAPEDYELDARHALDVLTQAIGEPPRAISSSDREAATARPT